MIIFKPTTAPFLSPVYAALEGVLLGAISALFEAKYPGIVLQVLDFDFIEKGAEHGAPKYMEWYAAFGLVVT